MERCFVVDPVCAMTFGHSLNSMKYFSDLARNFFPDVKTIASKHLPEIEESTQIDKYFNFYYFDIFDIQKINSIQTDPGLKPLRDNRDIAAYDFCKFLLEYNVTDQDTIFLPNADFYSVIGLTSALARFKGRRSPRVLLRLIGVMENSVESGLGKVNECLQKVLRAISAGQRISVAAETPKYAARLQDILQIPIQTAPYPAFQTDILPSPIGNRLTVLCGGSGRSDKGYYRLLNIINICNKQNAPVNFIIQNIPEREQYCNIDYINKLYAMPNVKMLPGTISYPEVVQSYSECNLSLLPYDQATYEYRGSAMLMESILFGRPSIGQTGTAFADQLKLYAAGVCAGTDQEFAQAIMNYVDIGRDEIFEHAKLSRRRYIDDVSQKYKLWMGR